MRSLSIFLLALFLCPESSAQLYFPPTDGSDDWETVDPQSLNWCPEKIDSLISFLDEKNTKAFMVLKDGRIVIEQYFDDHSANDNWYWASAAKTITATLVGKALEDGLIELNDPVSEYIGMGWTSCDSIDEVTRTIFHQLSMTSSFSNSILIWDCVEPECFQCTGLDPGEEWHYHNGVYRLLPEVVEEATGLTRNQYTNQVIGDITGISGFWLDNLYFSKHRDMARFGLLALNNFVWDDQSVLNDQEFIADLTSPSQSLNPSYGYLWWLNGQSSHMLPLNPTSFQGSLIPSGPDDMFMALGANDQKIYVVPSQNLVVTRQGNEAVESTPASSVFDVELWSYLSDMECETLGDSKITGSPEFLIHPNPVPTVFNLPDFDGLESVSLFSIDGRFILDGRPGDRIELDPGVYIAVGRRIDGSAHSTRFVVK